MFEAELKQWQYCHAKVQVTCKEVCMGLVEVLDSYTWAGYVSWKQSCRCNLCKVVEGDQT